MIGKRIAERMAEQGFSESELGRRAGVPQPTVHRIITGESLSPRQLNIEKIAKALGVSANWLWTGKKDLPFPKKSSVEEPLLIASEPAKTGSSAKRRRVRANTTKLEIKVVKNSESSSTFTSLEPEKLLRNAVQELLNDYISEIYQEEPMLVEALKTYRIAELKLLLTHPLPE